MITATANPPFIAPSILAADFARLGDEVNAVLEAGADLIHFDVMDNHYVPNLSIGPLVLDSLRGFGITAPMDVHLMVKPVDRLIEDFIKSGADIISVHPESTEHLHRTLTMIREADVQPGLVFNPATPLAVLSEVIELVDLVLIMSVNPGFGGQAFIPGRAREQAQQTREASSTASPRATYGWRSTAASRPTTSQLRPRLGPTPSSPARQSSAAVITPPPLRRCETPSHRPDSTRHNLPQLRSDRHAHAISDTALSSLPV